MILTLTMGNAQIRFSENGDDFFGHNHGVGVQYIKHIVV